MDIQEKNLLTLMRLTNQENTTLNKVLNESSICVVIPCEPNDNEWVGATTLVNLLVRLYPNVYIISTSEHFIILQDLAQRIQPDNSLRKTSGNEYFTATIFVGYDSHKKIRTKNPLYFDSDGWIARFSRDQRHYDRGIYQNPLAAAVSACFAANELFKTLFNPYLKGAKLSDSFSVSVFDYSIDNESHIDLPHTQLDIGEIWLAGVGAVGNGFLFALSLIDTLSGTIHLVDNRHVDDSNLQRYILLGHSDIGKPKCEVVTKAFEHSGVIVDPYKGIIQECFSLETVNGKIDTLICALDSINNRKEVQVKMPRLILNGWTKMDEFGITRHELDSPYRCLSCLYDKTERADPNVDIAQQTGFSVEEVQELLRNNIPLTDMDLRRIAEYKGISSNSLISWQGRTINSFFQEAICGGSVITTDTGEETVPLAHVSALTGILLAIELIKEKMGHPLTHKMQLNLLGTPHKYMKQLELKDERCFCSDEDYLDAYRKKWKE